MVFFSWFTFLRIIVGLDLFGIFFSTRIDLIAETISIVSPIPFFNEASVFIYFGHGDEIASLLDLNKFSKISSVTYGIIGCNINKTFFIILIETFLVSFCDSISSGLFNMGFINSIYQSQ